ncbi:hypothetical protein GZ77_21160 [Endozoicomonas montiporae]|uniref:Uncharacterized protein n=2 Tax=Endozoicomonas montiporae TaxID=1027273 RepID=A0A081N3C0_9GAMM|nr:hypothetical protein [Endozoicomonas montiporae]AMO58240.1 hypothetical protein EZMO1_4323 [Endozoicomonas montiporae CL-33]KEQ12943.1 hypothetical protein GZ77_21160 [Endozoicomonas montiporae]
MNLTEQDKELLERQIGDSVNINRLANEKTPDELAGMAVVHTLDFRRLLGSLECVQMYLETGKISEAHKLVNEAVEFYHLVGNVRTREMA